MLPEQLPNCACGNHNWKSGGASFGGPIDSQWFTCSNGDCGRPALLLSNRSGFILLQPAGDLREFNDIKLNEWINSVLLPTWLDFDARLAETLKPIELAHRHKLCDQLGLAHDVESIPEELDDQWEEGWKEYYRDPENKCPEGFHDQPIPPKLTAYNMIAMLFTRDQKWEPVDLEASDRAEVPPDPIRVRHDLFYKEVFAAIKEVLGVDISPIEVENLYSENTALQPWYLFGINGIGIRVGPRKRVFQILVEVPKHREPMETKVIREIAMTDQVTYTADAEWQSSKTTSRLIEIHAWNKEKLIHYLTIIGQQAMIT